MARKPKYADSAPARTLTRKKSPKNLEVKQGLLSRIEKRKAAADYPTRTTDVDKPLTEQQRMFVYYFVEEKQTQTAAARLANYSNPGSSAFELMKSPKIQAAIAEARAEYAAASQMTKKKVIDGFLEAIDLARTMAEPATMVSGWREVGKMCGFYEPTKHEIKVSVRGELMLKQLQTMSDEELLALAEQDTLPLRSQFEEAEDIEFEEVEDSENEQ